MPTLSPPALRRAAPFAPVVIRVVVGVIMAAHGWQKLSDGVGGFAEGALAGLGVPAPLVVAWLVTIIELVGGIALIVGAVTRLAAIGNALVLIGAIALVKIDLGLIAEEGAGAELDLAILAGLVALVLLGPGRPSVDHALGLEDATPTLREGP